MPHHPAGTPGAQPMSNAGVEQYAFDPSERPKAGHRSREWTAVAGFELEVVREMARCLPLIVEGRVPE